MSPASGGKIPDTAPEGRSVRLSDSRVDAVVAKFHPNEAIEQAESFYRTHAAKLIRQQESAGLLVLDPNSPELVERIARELARQVATSIPDFAGDYVERYWTQFQDRARAVLAALQDLPPATPAGGTPLPSGTPLTDRTPGDVA